MKQPDSAVLYCLKEQLCFALYTASNAIIRRYRNSLGEIGLTFPQYLIVTALMEVPSMTSGELAREVRLDAGALTPVLNRLVAAGFIERTHRRDDERIIDNRLTPTGLALREGLMRAQASIRSEVDMKDEDLEALREVLQTLTQKLTVL